MKTVDYSFHRLARINIESSEKSLSPYYDHYFRFFEVSGQQEPPDYLVREFSQFQLPVEYRNVSDIFLGFEKGVCLPSEDYALVCNNGQITEYTDTPNRATNLWLQTCLLRQGVSLVHSAGLMLNGQGFIFPAFGGAGKTMLIAALRKHPGFRFFGDDFVAVDKSGTMYAYPSDFSIYPQHLELFPEIEGTIYSEYFVERERRPRLWDQWYLLPGNPFLRSIAMRLRKTADPRQLGPLLPSLPEWNLDYIKVPATEVLTDDQIGTTVPLKHCMLLSRYSGDELQIIDINSEQLVKKLSGIMNVEFRYSLIYQHLLASFGVIDLKQFEESQRSVLETCFSNMQLREVLIPMTMSPTDYVEHMEEIVLELAG